MQPATPPLEVTPEELEALLESVREALGEAGYQKLQAAIRTLSYVTELLETREATLASLRRLLCRTRSERTEAVLEQAGIPRSPTPREPSPEVGSKKPGHGRKGAQAYPGAQRIAVPHATLYRGDRCPGCRRGKVYPLQEPGLLVRLRGQTPIAAIVYELEKLRCNLCGEVFTAQAPAGIGEAKYDATAASMIALLRYGSGFPWNRLADLEESLGLPPARCHAMRDRDGSRRSDPTGDGRVDSPGGARPSAAQRRHLDAGAGPAPQCRQEHKR